MNRRGHVTARLVPGAALLLLWACSDNPVTPELEPEDTELGKTTVSAAITKAEPLEGCAVFAVALQGLNRIQVQENSETTCGPLVLVFDSASYDRRGGRAALTFDVENHGETDALPPVLVASWEDSLTVTEPPGQAGNPNSEGRLNFAASDSVADDDDLNVPGALLWRSKEGTDGTADGSQRFEAITIELDVHDGVREFELRLRLVAEPAIIDIPAHAPDTVPADLYDVLDPDWLAPPHAMAVTFHAGLSPEEKSRIAAAAGAVEVLGGARFADDSYLDGIYILRVRTDGTMGPLQASMAAMNADDRVVAAFALVPMSTFWRGARDAGDWAEAEWRTRPDSADGQNWAHELVAAPLAWGCATGSSQVRVGVVDKEFTPMTDLVPNLAKSVSSPVDSGTHGTAVSSVIAARGDNQRDMTGMMWRAALAQYDIDAPDPRNRGNKSLGVVLLLGDAIQEGAKIVNASVGLDWGPNGFNRRPGTAKDTTIVEDVRKAIVGHLQFLLDHFDGVVVIAAGNDSLPAYWSGTPTLAEDKPERTVVVGAGAHMRPRDDGTVDLAAFSNHGPLVDLVAPGEQVYMLDRIAGGIRPHDGTSYAAPFVTGTLGLLASFDPSIPGDSLKALLMEGAREGGRTAVGQGGSYPLLNAYEALKAAGRRHGAPLCGNLLSTEDGFELRALRGDGWETLATLPGNYGGLNVPHGGRFVDAWLFNTDTRESHELRLAWDQGVWRESGTPPDKPYNGVYDGGVFNSMAGISHEPDTLARVESYRNPHKIVLRVANGPDYPDLIDEIPFDEPDETSGEWVCVRWKYFEYDGDTEKRCGKSVKLRSGAGKSMQVSWVPQGGKIILRVRRYTLSGAITGTLSCGDGWTCHNWFSQHDWNDTRVYEIDLRTKERRHLWSVPYDIAELGVSEDGQTIPIVRIYEVARFDFTWGTDSDGRWSSTGTASTITDQCAAELRDYETGEVVSAGSETACRENYSSDDRNESRYRFPELGMGS